MRQTLGVALVAVLVLLAGCSAGTGGDVTATHTTTHDGTDTTTTADGATGGDTTTAADGSPSGDGASTDSSVNFYLSDRPNAISDFDHLNVTVTKVGIHRTGGENGSESGEWLEYDVNATVDLTRLLGANASKIGTFDLPNGSYTKVFVYVSDTRGEINGTDKRVKLPSDKLQLNKGFTVGDGESPSFVFDIAVHKAGKSGKYILSPVVSESGTGDEVEIRDVDAEDEESERGDDATGEETAEDSTSSTETTATVTPTTTTASATTTTATASTTTTTATPTTTAASDSTPE